MQQRPVLAVAASLVIGGLVAGASVGVAAQATPDVTPAGGPVGIVALGHSGVTGWGSNPTRPDDLTLENSWATGTNREVDSVYRRLIRVLPETEGHVSNQGQGSAPSETLVQQARLALQEVPQPAVVIIQTIDADIRCDGTDADHVAAFGRNVAATLEVITTASPDSKILVIGQAGRPTSYAAAIADVPEVVASLTGIGSCFFFEPSGELAVEQVAELTAIIEAYEAEQARVCSEFPTCRTDDGLMATWIDDDTVLSEDWNHFTIEGHARKAEMLWPVIADLLDLPT